MKKVLLVSNHDPTSTGYGAGQRTHQLWVALRAIGHTDVAWMCNAGENRIEHREIGGSRITKIETSPKNLADYWWNGLYSRSIASAFGECIDTAGYDVVVSRYVIPAAKLGLETCGELLIDFDDPVYRFAQSALTSPRALLKEVSRLFNQVLMNWLVRHGRLRNAHYFFVNSRDRDHFPELRSTLLPNIPYLPGNPGQHSRSADASQTLIFIGLMTYRPNIEAVDYFLDRIWPGILQHCPDATFRIVGKLADQERLRWQAYPRCTVEGFVKDLDEVYATAAVAVSPIRSGGGSNIKIPEACAYGCPVVATEYSYAGWADFFEPDRDLLVAASAEDFTDKCVQLLHHREMADQLAKQGRQRALTDLSLAAFTRRLAEQLD